MHSPLYLSQWLHTYQQNIMTSHCAFVSLIQTDEAQQSESFYFYFSSFQGSDLVCSASRASTGWSRLDPLSQRNVNRNCNTTLILICGNLLTGCSWTCWQGFSHGLVNEAQECLWHFGKLVLSCALPNKCTNVFLTLSTSKGLVKPHLESGQEQAVGSSGTNTEICRQVGQFPAAFSLLSFDFHGSRFGWEMKIRSVVWFWLFGMLGKTVNMVKEEWCCRLMCWCLEKTMVTQEI